MIEKPIIIYHRYKMEKGNRCESCRSANYGRSPFHSRIATKLEVVHLDGDLNNFQPGNLFSICQFCKKKHSLRQLREVKKAQPLIC